MRKDECKVLLAELRLVNQRFLLAFAHDGVSRMNELRRLIILNVDLDRKQIHLRQGK
jgi:hypothetical protein